MRSPVPSLFRILGLALALAAATLTTAPPGASAQECQFLMDDGTTRECTFTERYGQCLVWAYQSYNGCADFDDDWGDWLICETALQVDLLACTLGMLGDAVSLLSPF